MQRHSTGPGRGRSVEIVTIGETMIMMTPLPTSRLDQSQSLSVNIGGAESNVAMYAADLGHTVRWVGRVGDDPFGRMILRQLRAAGVDTSLASIDPHAPTGVYFKDPDESRTTVHYYRDGSAGAQLEPDILTEPGLAGAEIVHLTGVTAALSPNCYELLRAVIVDRVLDSPLVSFDINFRASLWSAEAAAPVLAELADSCDLVFVGLDEAHSLWGCETSVDVRTALPNAGCVVVKNNAVGAESFRSGPPVFSPSPRVNVVESVGAGDAFAAGYLAGVLRKLDEMQRLRLGHLVAAQALSVTSDHAPIPSLEWFDRHIVLPLVDWDRLDLRPYQKAVS